MNVMHLGTRSFIGSRTLGLAAVCGLAMAAGCAEGVDPGSGEQGNSSGDGRFGGDTIADAGPGGPSLPDPVDASPFQPDANSGFGQADAEPAPEPEPGEQRVTLSYNSSTEIEPDLFAACRQDGFQTRNIYLRVFDFSDFGVSSDFTVEEIHIGVSRAESADGENQPVQVLLARQQGGGAPDLSSPVLDDRDILLADGELGFLNVRDIDEVIEPGESLLVAFVVPDGTESGDLLEIGVNRESEDAPSFIIAEDCGVDDPAPFEDFFTTRWIVAVTGVHES